MNGYGTLYDSIYGEIFGLLQDGKSTGVFSGTGSGSAHEAYEHSASLRREYERLEREDLARRSGYTLNPDMCYSGDADNPFLSSSIEDYQRRRREADGSCSVM